MCVFSAKMWFVKTLNRIVKFESQVIKSNPVGEYSTYGTYGGAIFQLCDFGDLDTDSKDYKNSKSLPGRVMIFETFEKFFKVRINFWESFQKPHPDPCARVKCFQIIFSSLEHRIYYDLGKWRAIRAGVVDLFAWVACYNEWHARVMCQHAWREWRASVGKVGGVLAWLARVAY